MTRTHEVPRFYAFWAINAAIVKEEAFTQLREFVKAGLDGIVVHPRYYPGTPPYLSDEYFDQISDLVEEASRLGLRAWLYDENGWPSGTAGGEVLTRRPDLVQRWLTLEPGGLEQADFFVEGKGWCIREHTGTGVDYLHPELAEVFLDLTHSAYQRGMRKDAFDAVEAFFSDEPELGLGHAYDHLPDLGGIPWTPDLPSRYAQRYGRSLMDDIGGLFFDQPDSAESRTRFWELVADIFAEGFLKPINDWCVVRGKRLAAHLKGEERPLFQVPTSGSAATAFRQMSMPGIDMLERFPGNTYYPRLAVTAARQWGDGRAMAEAWGGAGWGADPGDLELFLNTLTDCGITDIVIHISQYRLNSGALDDWPPSVPLHISWKESFSAVLDAVRRRALSRPQDTADMLVIAPQRGAMERFRPADLLLMNVHDGSVLGSQAVLDEDSEFLSRVRMLEDNGALFHVADERTLEQADVSDGTIRVGRFSYRRLLLDPGAVLPDHVRARLSDFVVDWTCFEGRAGSVDLTGGSLEEVRASDLRWTVSEPQRNLFLLDLEREDGGFFSAVLDARSEAPLETVLVCSDPIRAVEVNGAWVPSVVEGVTSVPLVVHSGRSRVRLVFADDVSRPRVWVRGEFRVLSDEGWRESPGGALTTRGPFVLISASLSCDLDGHALIESGYPFLSGAISMSTTFHSPMHVDQVSFVGVHASAIEVVLDGGQPMWVWAKGGRWIFTVDLDPGDHQMDIRLIPSSFNQYGPHHYYRGDAPLISPAQIEGYRNFADPSDAPERTHVPEWFFRRLSAPTGVVLERRDGVGIKDEDAG